MISRYYSSEFVYLMAATKEELEWERGFYSHDPEMFQISFDPRPVDTADGPQWVMQVAISNPNKKH